MNGRRADQRGDDRPRVSLGDLLYARGPKPPVSEQQWVDLVRSVAAGDQRALRGLYERTHRIVFTLIMRITRDRETAEEVTLDVFHDVWRRASTYEPEGGTVVGWIMNQARSRAIDRVRFQQRTKRVDPGPDGRLPVIGVDDPRDTVELKQQGERLRIALASLTSDERRAIETAFFSGCTHAEVAERLDQPLGTVKTRIRSGLAKLRRILAGEEADVA